MTLIDAAILGLIEGITEFLPVSSTAHLVLAAQMLELKQDRFMTAFEIIIQIAPIFSVMLIYKERLLQGIGLWLKLGIAFVPTGVVGLLFHKQIAALFNNATAIGMMLLTGIAFLLIEYLYREKSHHVATLEAVSFKQALLIGFAQTLALVPGVSRSGTTILAGMLAGLRRENAMGFSFLLAIPTMGAASGYMLYKEAQTLSFDHIGLLATGFAVSFVVGYIAVKAFLAIVSRYSFKPFGIYLIATALLFALFGAEL